MKAPFTVFVLMSDYLNRATSPAERNANGAIRYIMLCVLDGLLLWSLSLKAPVTVVSLNVI